jgi:lysyl-tRNA synthetase class 1
MFWADAVADEIVKSRRYKPYWVDDMKTPSGRVHVGALRGVIVHDLVFKALKNKGVNAKFTYVFENHDPMDDIPSYLPRDVYEKYLGLPLFKIPSPEPGFSDFASCYALEFKKAFNAMGCEPEIIWTKDLYTSGKMNPIIKDVLDKAVKVREVYKILYQKNLPNDWYPFQIYCPSCGKVSTTNVTNWDGEKVTFECEINKVKWTNGCGEKGKVSPFSSEKEMAGKLPWKVEWPAKWKAIGITVEGAGKDHMSSGGSHDFAKLVCENVINYPVPYPIAYEWLLVGGRKMSSSRGVGTSAIEMLDILPPELNRFLMVRIKVNQQINFDPTDAQTIPSLFDDYQKCADAYFDKVNEDSARIFELSQIGSKVQRPPNIRFSVLAQWVQMPNMEEEIKKEGFGVWAKYAKVWVEKYAPESEKFEIKIELPEIVKNLSEKQKTALNLISKELDRKWTGDDFQTKIYEIGKNLDLSGKETFTAIYLSLIGKDHGPKAAWLILSLDKEFVRKRFTLLS